MESAAEKCLKLEKENERLRYFSHIKILIYVLSINIILKIKIN